LRLASGEQVTLLLVPDEDDRLRDSAGPVRFPQAAPRLLRVHSFGGRPVFVRLE
jgi:hypothetical protein